MAELLPFPTLLPRRSPVVHPPQQPPAALSDEEARTAALNIQRSWIVEAPAGSGKTGLLIQRYLKLLAFGGVQRPEEVLVLTFTRKADGELRSRVLEQLAAANEAVPLPPDAKAFDLETRSFAEEVLARDRLLQWHILESPSRLNVRTIDSFCAELAGSMPLLSGASRRQPVDDASPLYALAAERTLGELGGPDHVLNSALERLIRLRDAQVPDCVRLLADMLAQREQWGELIPLDGEQLSEEFLDTTIRPRLEHTLERIVSEGLARAARALGQDHLAELTAFARNLSTESGYQGQPNPLAEFATFQGPLSSSADHLPRWREALNLVLTSAGEWRKKPRRSHLKLEIPELSAQLLEQFIDQLRHRESENPELCSALCAIRELPPPCYPDEQWPTVKALCRVLRRALKELQAVFAQRGQCDFTEIALTARHLFDPLSDRGPLGPDPLDSPAARLAHLLVDEMQDTSSGQYKLLESLTQTWDGASQTIFLVGDPKQSIYAFRQARVERFLRTMETRRLGDVPIGPLRLTANFRSQANLVHEFNDLFRPIFPEPDTSPHPGVESSTEVVSVPFVQATATRRPTIGTPLHWHVLATDDAITGAVTPEQHHARQIRATIEAFLATRSETVDNPPSVAVLARNRAHLAPIIAEFHRDYGSGNLPFRAVDVEALTERPEVLDLVALTRALLHPADRIAWLAVLRSPLCGLTLADLLALTGEGPGADRTATVQQLVSSRHSLLSPEGQKLLARVWPTLQTAGDTLGRTPLSTHVERTWRTLGGDVPLPSDQRRNANRFIDLLRKLETGSDPISLSLLNLHLRKLYAEPTSAPTSVELMTIHKAKGLEWDLVLVPALEKGSGRNDHALLKWLELDNPDAEAEFILAPIQSKGDETSSLSAWLNRGETRRQAAEAARLLYVACTRAREELHLFTTVDRKADGSINKPRATESLLQAAWPAAQAILERQLAPATTPATIIPFPAAQEPEPLSLAASGSDDQIEPGPEPSTSRKPRIRGVLRLPSDFDPLASMQPSQGAGLPYPSAAQLPQSALFSRPEGSFPARAFGNTVHRFLELLSTRLTNGNPVHELQSNLAGWSPRLVAFLRNEGLSQVQAVHEAQRALHALTSTLQDPDGLWLLSPHQAARNEVNLVGAGDSTAAALRADRVFLAGPGPQGFADNTHLWIVDYKTAELGGRSRDAFLEDQKQKYMPQMTAYAEAAHAAGTPLERIRLALYLPLLPALIYWPGDSNVTTR